MFRKFKPHLCMILIQMAVSFLYFLVEASFSKGMNPHVFVTYRQAVGGLVIFPFAYVLEREARPKLTKRMFLELFILSLTGISLAPNMYFASLKYTSPSFVTSMINIISSLTFVIAVALRLETVDIKNPRGLAKIVGTVLSLTGALTMALYKGHAIQSLQSAPFHIRSKSVHKNWIKGSILAVASCISWSLWYIMQAIMVKKYPAQLSLSAWMNFIGSAQSAVFTGVVCCGLMVFGQIWTTEQKGPVFVSMFNPLGTVLVTILAYFVMGQQLHIGSILGGFLVIIGLYLLLWGKESDQDYNNSQQECSPIHIEQKECRTHRESSLAEHDLS